MVKIAAEASAVVRTELASCDVTMPVAVVLADLRRGGAVRLGIAAIGIAGGGRGDVSENGHYNVRSKDDK